MASAPIPFRLPPALLGRMDALAAITNLSRSDIVRLSLLRVLEVAEKDPAALLAFSPELLAMDGRRSASMTAAAALAPDLRLSLNDAPDPAAAALPAPRPVNYSAALKRVPRRKKPTP